MAYNTIKIKNYGNNFSEKNAASAITPGHLIERTSGDTVQPHSTADGAAQAMFALEDELQGKEITDAYSANNPVQIWHCQKGDLVYALIANGEDIAIGDKLVSNGDGTLKERAGASSGEDVASIIAVAREAVDMSSSSGADPSGRCVVEIL